MEVLRTGGSCFSPAADVAARNAALAPDEYAQREESDLALLTTAAREHATAQRDGGELMLFCCGPINFVRGQHMGFCLFEPRYRLMVARLLERPVGQRHFGIVLDGGIHEGSPGRLARLVFERQTADGSYDVVVQGGEAFVVHHPWLIAVGTSTPLGRQLPPLACMRLPPAERGDPALGISVRPASSGENRRRGSSMAPASYHRGSSVVLRRMRSLLVRAAAVCCLAPPTRTLDLGL